MKLSVGTEIGVVAVYVSILRLLLISIENLCLEMSEMFSMILQPPSLSSALPVV